MDARKKASLLIDWALDLGFDRAGIAGLEPLEHGSALVDWLARGRHAGMGYLARRLEVRLDPGRIFPGARSAICVALHYAGAASSDDKPNDLWRGVARYARGEDYHQIMGQMLAALGQRIETEFRGSRTRSYVDTGPVLERELAALAGLGAVGKNTCLLDAGAGSWFFLGEVFTSLELAVSTPLADLCGSCSRCLESCPTGALSAPFHLDSNRCISYWTIEHKGTIPTQIRPQLDGWVFGCDVCQEVCPANEGDEIGAHGAFSGTPERSALDLEALLGLDTDQYRELFRGSPMKRAKLSGLKRNVAVAMGNSGEPRYVLALSRALDDSDPVVRRHAAWALGRIGGDQAVASLASALEREREPDVLSEVAAALDDARDLP